MNNYVCRVENVLPGMRVRKSGSTKYRKIAKICVREGKHVILSSEKFWPNPDGSTRYREMWFEHGTIMQIKEG